MTRYFPNPSCLTSHVQRNAIIKFAATILSKKKLKQSNFLKRIVAVVQVDAANDLALLKADGRFALLPIAASRTVALGGTVATVGFPDIGLQGFAPKVS